jgi:pilus assembly protein FimV
MMVREANESNRKETEELRSKVKDLEAQLTDIQKLLKLKSEQLAQAQNANAQLIVAQSQPEILPPKTEIATTSTLPPPAPKKHSAPIEPKSTDTPKVKSTLPATKTSQPIASTPHQPPITAPTEDWLAYLPDITSWLPNDFNLGWLLKIIEDPLYQMIIGGSVLSILLILTGVIWFNQPRHVDTSAKELADSEIFTQNSDISKIEGLEEPSLSTMTRRPEAPTDTSFITDFSPSDIEEGQQETGEVDPAAEADVYIAYGRYQQAENLLTQTLAKSPERTDIKLKLLEIYHNIRNVASFNTLAEEMNADGFADTDPSAWKRICDLGKDLTPEHPLFGTSDNITEPSRMGGGISQKSETTSDNFDGLDLNLDTVLSELPSAAKLSEMRIKSFQAIQTIVTTPQVLSAASMPVFANKSIDISLSNKSQQQSTPVVPMQSHAQDREFEVDLDLSGLPSISDMDLGVLNFDDDTGIKSKQTKELSKKSTITSISQISQEEKEDSVPAIDLYELGLGSDLNDVAISDIESIGEHNISLEQFNTPNSSEEIENKLDLARVYMDIDPDTAKGMLEEVLKDGDSTQQAVAKKLLASLG